MDMVLTGAITPGQSGLGSNSYTEIFHTSLEMELYHQFLNVIEICIGIYQSRMKYL